MNTNFSFYPRFIEARISEALSDTPVVFLAGPRQSGKTTLVRHYANQGLRYLTLDDEVILLAAKQDPIGMIRQLDCAVIDEVQRAPQLLLAIKKTVDEDRRPGRFLLTGSANLLSMPTMADSLAGRMETLTLLPLSQSEIRGSTANWLDAAFNGSLLAVADPLIGEVLQETVLAGGYPESVSRPTFRRRSAWAKQYIDAIIQRDVRDIADIDRLEQLPSFLQALAHVAGQQCNYTQLGGQIGLDHKTVRKYIGIFEQLYLLRRVDAWASNRLKRIVKTPKLQFIDSGLLSVLLDFSPKLAEQNRSRFGNILETFVYAELLKCITTAEGTYRLFYYRDHDQFEVDLLVENAGGELLGIEIKAAATLQASDLRGLKRLASVAGNKFKLGVILYDGLETLPLGNAFWAVPISSLWGKY